MLKMDDDNRHRLKRAKSHVVSIDYNHLNGVITSLYESVFIQCKILVKFCPSK